MPDQLIDELRRYGEALEKSVLAADPQPAVVTAPWWSRHRRVLGVAACLAVLVGGAALVAIQDARRQDVTTTDQTAVLPSPTATSAATSSTPTTATTLVPPAVVPVEGTATWVDGPDPRGTLRVGACPADSQQPCEPSPTVDVAPDGSFTLLLPTDTASTEWIVAAYVSVSDPTFCIFNCEWRTEQVGPSVTVSVAQSPAPRLQLSVAARVIDVYVFDRDGHSFEGGGVYVDDSRCSGSQCAELEQADLFFDASSDGAARLVLDPSVTYVIHGQAMNTGWADPLTYVDGDAFWNSPDLIVRGSDLSEGHVFLVRGGP